MKYDFDLDLNNRNSLSILLSRIKNNSQVLEFGPANGRMTKYMKERLNCKVYAVELDENSAKDAAKYTEKIVIGSIEDYTWIEEFKDIKFDYIVFADVLEHLYYPEKVLNKIKDFLMEEGSVLVSIPNIAHNSIIINLLNNEFNYNNIGLLDNTHIRFFTKKTFDNLIRKSGYFVSYETAVYLKPEETEFKNSYSHLNNMISDYLQKLEFGESYQLIYEFKTKEYKIESFFEKNEICNYAQLYLDLGDGFSEQNSLKIPIDSNKKEQILAFDLKKYHNINCLRLDPLNDYCLIEIIGIKINSSETNINIVNSNSIYNNNKIFCFNEFDPQIVLDISTFTNVKNIEFYFKYINTGNSAVLDINSFLSNELKNKNQEIQDLIELTKIKNKIKKFLGLKWKN